MIASAASGSHIEVEDHFIVRLRQYGIEEFPQVRLRLLGRNGKAVDLEHLDSVLII